MALLDLADRWRRETGGFIAVGHVDHGLRGAASRADARFVQRECARRGLPGAVRRAPAAALARRRKRGLEDAARRLRYQALSRIARRFHCPVVATAHTLDDQAETVFINLFRGAGPAGLAGMAPSARWPAPSATISPRLVRPFLSVRKEELLSYLRARRLRFRTDATNNQPLFLRNRLRPVLQAWEKERPGFLARVARTAGLLRDEEDYWSRRLARNGFRREKPRVRLERGPFLRYHVAEQRRRLRHLYGITRFGPLERVRGFAADRATGPLDIPGGKVVKTARYLFFKW
jgi:tRNA(Ile)-lysidine synthase